MNNFAKWWQTIKISWSKYTAYRLNFFLQVIGPAIVFFFIKYNLWSSIYGGDEQQVIQGYNFQEMIHYHIWTLIISLLAQGHNSMNLSEDIRLGRISSYLIYPFNFWEFHTASFLSFQFLQLLISLVTITIISSFGFLSGLSLSQLVIGILFCFYISFFWYLLQYLCGILAFWLEETWILRVILQTLSLFLSGAILPLDFYPKAFVDLLQWTPFPYLTYYPVKIFEGDYSKLPIAIAVIGLWIVIAFILNRFIWKRGIKNYTAAGI